MKGDDNIFLKYLFLPSDIFRAPLSLLRISTIEPLSEETKRVLTSLFLSPLWNNILGVNVVE